MLEHKSKPTLFVNTSYELFLGNSGGTEMVLASQELCGFNLGVYENKPCEGQILI